MSKTKDQLSEWQTKITEAIGAAGYLNEGEYLREAITDAAVAAERIGLIGSHRQSFANAATHNEMAHARVKAENTELLATLEGYMVGHPCRDKDCPTHAAARKAIAKAKGAAS